MPSYEKFVCIRIEIHLTNQSSTTVIEFAFVKTPVLSENHLKNTLYSVEQDLFWTFVKSNPGYVVRKIHKDYQQNFIPVLYVCCHFTV